jgi:Winged helix DNA-binding domain
VAEGSERILSQRELNRSLLARQLLLDRGQMPLPRLLESIAGIQAQYAPSMYVGVWSRLDSFQRDDLTKALEKREVVQGWLMRSTIHLVSAEDYWPLALAVRGARREWFLRAWKNGPTEARVKSAARKLRKALADGPLRQRDIDQMFSRELRIGASLWVDMVRVPPSGTWERRRADLYGLAEEWLGPPTVTVDEGMELLVRRYLGAFGPASRADIRSWSGLPVATIKKVLDRLELQWFRSEDWTDLMDLPNSPLPDADTPAPVRLLPTWDATLLAHSRRTQVLPEEYRTRIFNSKNPQSFPTFLVDGQVAGTWRYEGDDVQLDEFAPLPQRVRLELADEAKRLAAFHR